MRVTDNQLLVIFGASGDLTQRKLIPALLVLFRQQLLPMNFRVLGVGRKPLNTEHFRTHILESLKARNDISVEAETLEGFARLLHYICIDTADENHYQPLKVRIEELHVEYNTQGNTVFYMATPPGMYEAIASGLKNAHLTSHPGAWRRLIVEKPFGINLASARALNKHLASCFSEDQIYRIDHYLGKETVQNLMVTRFSNGIFEPLWNRHYVHHIEITSAESIGMENRGGYYDQAGALRDMVQNHLLQLVTLVAMEPPTQIHARAIRNETLKVLQSIRPLEEHEIEKKVVRGQYTASTVRGSAYRAYREEQGVDPRSRTETYVALRIMIDNWRWGGVPFYIRTGKCLPTRVTEIVVHFNPTPHRLFCFDTNRLNSENQLVIRIQPDEGMLLKFGMKVPGAGFRVKDVNMDFHYADMGNGEIPEAYQRLLLDCMQGDATLYTRNDAIEQAWKIVDPILQTWKNNPDLPIYGYPAGTWGPTQAEELIEGDGMTWRHPCKNLTNDGIYCEL